MQYTVSIASPLDTPIHIHHVRWSGLVIPLSANLVQTSGQLLSDCNSHHTLPLKTSLICRDLSRIDVVISAEGIWPQISCNRITLKYTSPEDPKVSKVRDPDHSLENLADFLRTRLPISDLKSFNFQIVDDYMGKLTEKMTEVIGYSACDLDGRFEAVRAMESNLGDFMCDVMRSAVGCDIVYINGGDMGRSGSNVSVSSGASFLILFVELELEFSLQEPSGQIKYTLLVLSPLEI